MVASIKQLSESGFQGSVEAADKPVLQNSNLLAVASVLQQARAVAKEAEQASGTGVSLADEMAEMVGLLGRLKVALGQATSAINQMQLQNNNSMLEQMKANLAHADEQLQKLQDDMKSQTFWSKLGKALEIALGAILSVIAVATGQPELAALSIGLTIMAATGGFTAAAKLGSELFQALGVPKNIADALGDALVILGTIAVTMGVGALAAPEAVAGVVEGGAAVAEEATNVVGRILNWLSENNPFNYLSKTANLGVLAGSQALMNTNFATDFVNALAITDPAMKKKIQEAMEALTMIISFICSAGSAGSIMSTAKSTFLEGTSAMRFLQSPLITNGLNYAAIVSGLMTGVAKGTEASVEFKLADVQKALGEDRSMLQLMEGLSSMINASSQENIKSGSSTLRTWNDALAQLARVLASGQAEIAKVLNH